MRHNRRNTVLVLLIGLMTGTFAFTFNAHSSDMIDVNEFVMPADSTYWSAETKSGMKQQRALMKKAHGICIPWQQQSTKAVLECEHKMYQPILAEAHKIYAVDVQPKTIDGVYTEVVTPKLGVDKNHQHRVLINVHGGGFKYGSIYGGRLESMPMAAIGGFKVIAVNYRKAPEHLFPAAVEDVIKVYQSLLQDYSPEHIAIYGCSAGSRVTGEVIARLNADKMPLPAATGFLCSAPTGLDGDSNYIAAALKGHPPLNVEDVSYWSNVKKNDPLAFPGDHTAQLTHFPPSILMTSTRDYSLSPMVNMHQKMVKLGKVAELHIFEGFAHAEFLSMYTPEARQVAHLLTAFFDRHLAK